MSKELLNDMEITALKWGEFDTTEFDKIYPGIYGDDIRLQVETKRAQLFRVVTDNSDCIFICRTDSFLEGSLTYIIMYAEGKGADVYREHAENICKEKGYVSIQWCSGHKGSIKMAERADYHLSEYVFIKDL